MVSSVDPTGLDGEDREQQDPEVDWASGEMARFCIRVSSIARLRAGP
jgi:hypothetical protein